MDNEPTSGAGAPMAEGAIETGPETPKEGKSRGNAGAGRKVGSRNKTTAAVKDAILNAFTKVGGEDYLVKVARKDHKTFCALLGKVLPLQVQGDPNNPAMIIPVMTVIHTDGAGGNKP